MNLALWIIAGLLAVVFLASGAVNLIPGSRGCRWPRLVLPALAVLVARGRFGPQSFTG